MSGLCSFSSRIHASALSKRFTMLWCMLALLITHHALAQLEDYGIVYGNKDINKAKQIAWRDKRPLMMVDSMTVCGFCDIFESTMKKDPFKQFAIDNQIVLLELRGLTKTDANLYNWYMYNTPSHSTMYPRVYIFRMLKEPDLSLASADAFSPEECELLYASQQPWPMAAMNMGKSTPNVNGVSWSHGGITGNKLIALVSSFFPNDQGIPLQPSAEDTSMGVIPSTGNPASDILAWVAKSNEISLTAQEPAHQLVVEGEPGLRYRFYADVNGLAGQQGELNAITVKICTDAKGNGQLFRYVATSLSDLEKGFHFDAPATRAETVKYYLNIEMDPASPTASLNFKLRASTSAQNPEEGTPTNPVWKGATPGKWTMDAEDAFKKASEDGKPVILYFTGVTWCPRCIGAEALTLSAFDMTRTDAYYVLLDNRRREPNAGDDASFGLAHGPSLLTDAMANGYLASHGISDEDAAAKLQENRDLQLLLGTDSKSNWQGNAIAYPTFVVVSPAAADKAATPAATFNGADESFALDTVGRVYLLKEDKVALTPAELEQVIADFSLMHTNGIRETSQRTDASNTNFFETSEEPAETTIVLGAKTIAAIDKDGKPGKPEFIPYCARFNMIPEKSWLCEISCEAAADTDTATVAFMDLNGKEIKKYSNIHLRNGRIFFIPEDKAQEREYWVKIIPDNMTAAAEVTLTISYSDVRGTLSIAEAAAFACIKDGKVSIPVNFDASPEEESLSCICKLKPEPLLKPWCKKHIGDFTEYTAGKIVQVTRENPCIEIVLTPNSGDDWNATYDIPLFIETLEGDGTSVVAPANATICISSHPAFAPKQEQTEYLLCDGLAVEWKVPVVGITAPDKNIGIEGLDTLGLTSRFESQDGKQYIVIEGTPKAYDGHSENLAVTITLMDDKGIKRDDFTAYCTILAPPVMGFNYFTTGLVREDDNAKTLKGRLLMSKNGNETYDVFITIEGSEQKPPYSQLTWHHYDMATDRFNMQSPDGKLLLDIDSNGDEGDAFFSLDDTSYIGTLRAISQERFGDEGEYTGRYTVALRKEMDFQEESTQTLEYIFGWLLVDIDDENIASCTVQLRDGTSINGIESYVLKAPSNENCGQMIVFLPYSTDENKSWNTLALSLDIIKNSRRDEPNMACISSCYEGGYWSHDGIDEYINACGTVFNPDKSLAEQLASSEEDPAHNASFIFITEQPQNALAPSGIGLKETQAAKRLAPNPENILDGIVKDIVIDEHGEFTGTMTVFSRSDAPNDNTLTPQEVTIQGALTPTVHDCCTADQLVAVGYGFYEYMGTRHSLWIANRDYISTIASETEPVPDYETRTLAKTITPDQDVAPYLTALYQRLDTGEWFCTPTDNPTLDLTLDGTTPWRLMLVNRNVESTKASQVLKPIPLYCAKDTVTFATRNAQITLAQGWNIIGFPASMALQKDSAPSIPAFEFNADTNTYVPADKLVGGKAYWIFITDEDTLDIEKTELKVTPDKPSLQEYKAIAPARNNKDEATWTMLPAEDAPSGNCWFWNGNAFSIIRNTPVSDKRYDGTLLQSFPKNKVLNDSPNYRPLR